MSLHSFLDKIRVKSFATGEIVEVIYYSKEESLAGQFDQVVCIVPPESRSHFYNNKMITILESDIISVVYEVGDYVTFDMPGFANQAGEIIQIDENPDASRPYKIRHVDGSGEYIFWCGEKLPFKVTGKI